MSEFFTRRRRMALPSIVLMLAFVGGVVAAPIEVFVEVLNGSQNNRLLAGLLAASFIAGAVGAWLHWKRFMVPVTVAAICATAVAGAISLVMTVIGPLAPSPDTVLLPLVFAGGVAIFVYAMRWDISDRARQTRRSDVAFWLHLLAAPMIAHPLFHWLGITDGGVVGAGGVVLVLLVYVLFGIVALAIDRRALLVSALAYVLFALGSLFEEYGVVELSVALTALVIGSALLMLSAFWPAIRAAVVEKLPGDLREKLPLVGPVAKAA